MIIFGTRRFGWVDHVEGLGTVATIFVHVMFVPLIPTETWLVTEGNRGFRLRMSLKSVLVAWVRSALFWGGLVSAVCLPATFGITCVTLVPCAIGYFLVPLFVRKASPARAEQIRRELRGG